MEAFNVICYVDTDLINEKIQNGIAKDVRKQVRDTIKETVRELVQTHLSKIDLEEIVKRVYYETSRKEVEELVYRLRWQDYNKFSWNGKEVDPSPEKMFKLIAAYIGQVDLMSDDSFKKAVLDKAAYEISDTIIRNFGKNQAYKKTIATIKEGLNEKE